MAGCRGLKSVLETAESFCLDQICILLFCKLRLCCPSQSLMIALKFRRLVSEIYGT